MGTIILLAFGAFLGWLFDNFVLKRNQGLSIPGSNENFKNSNEDRGDRSLDRPRDYRNTLDVDRDGGDGAKVLQLDRHRKM